MDLRVRNQSQSRDKRSNGHLTKNTTQSKNKFENNNNKNRIPKNLRCDLENALVGLCDVWFGEIKPRLIRNNVKLHVHKNKEANKQGPYKEIQLTEEPVICSHNDPGTVDINGHI